MTVLVKALIEIWATWSLLQNFFLRFIMCLSVLCGCMCTTCMPDIQGGQKKPWVQFQRIPSYRWLWATTWVLGTLGHRFFKPRFALFVWNQVLLGSSSWPWTQNLLVPASLLAIERLNSGTGLTRRTHSCYCLGVEGSSAATLQSSERAESCPLALHPVPQWTAGYKFLLLSLAMQKGLNLHVLSSTSDLFLQWVLNVIKDFVQFLGTLPYRYQNGGNFVTKIIWRSTSLAAALLGIVPRAGKIAGTESKQGATSRLVPAQPCFPESGLHSEDRHVS